MQRLKRDSADLFWIHVPNNLEANLREAVPLIKDKRIKSVGISNVSLEHIRKAEALLEKEGRTFTEAAPEELDELWEKAKNETQEP